MKLTKEKDYTLKEGRKAVKWWKEKSGHDLSDMLSFLKVGEALDDFVKKIYNEDFPIKS